MTAQPAETMKRVYQYLGVTAFEHNFDEVTQVTQEDDLVFGIPGLHEILPKVAPQPSDYLGVLAGTRVRHLHQNYAWYFQLFGYQLNAV